MEKQQDSQSHRTLQLDGLRGIAIVLVILNHLRLGPLFDATPTILQPVLSSILVSGKIGVSILFLLSGFLMATIYPQVSSKFAFWQKRYTRIFPAFVAMCFALTIIRFFNTHLPPLLTAGVVLVVVAAGGFLWRSFMNLSDREKWGKRLFLGSFGLQIAVILSYIFLLPLVPSSVYYLLWPKWTQSLVTFAVNGTLALPFGNYVPQLDGAYWSIVTEVGFYIFYPLLFLPIISFITEKKSFTLGSLCTLLAFPFFFGLWLLFSGVLGFKMMQIYLGIYFSFGVAIGLIRDSPWIKNWQNLAGRLPSVILLLVCAVGVVGVPFFAKLTHLPELLDLIAGIIPVTAVFLITLSGGNAWSAFLRNRGLITLGNLSYALYLTHTIAIEMFVQNGEPLTISAMLQAAIPAIFMMALLSGALHVFLELPYFSKVGKNVNAAKPKATTLKTVGMRKVFIGGIIGFVFLLWVGHRVPVTLSSRVVNVESAHLPAVISLSTVPVVVPFVATYSDLGMALVNLKIQTNYAAVSIAADSGLSADQMLIIDLKDQIGQSLSTTSYPVSQLYDTKFHPVGFPLDPSSKGKNLNLNLSVSQVEKNRVISIVNDGSVLRTVYFPDKKALLRNPQLLGELLWEKVSQPFAEKDTWQIFLLSGPLLVLLGLLLLLPKRQNLVK